jgi:hypothetical protein
MHELVADTTARQAVDARLAAADAEVDAIMAGRRPK